MTQIQTKHITDFIRPFLKKGKAVALTGAGISAESGVPTFRGKGGLWEKYNPEIFANAEGLLYTFRSAPEKIVAFLTDLYSILLKAKPNPAHIALAQMEQKNLINYVITQNIDDLHRLAGSRNILELHGNAFRLHCPNCFKKTKLDREKLALILQEMQKYKHSKIRLLKLFSQFFPKCSCKKRLRIDIVLFGEILDQQVLTKAYNAIKGCSLLFLIGTSGVVFPAAQLPFVAKEEGAKIVEINNDSSELSSFSDYQIKGRAGEILPELIKDL